MPSSAPAGLTAETPSDISDPDDGRIGSVGSPVLPGKRPFPAEIAWPVNAVSRATITPLNVSNSSRCQAHHRGGYEANRAKMCPPPCHLVNGVLNEKYRLLCWVFWSGGVEMGNIQELSGPPEPAVDGSKVTADRADEETATGIRPDSPDREATRYLSAATQIDIKYAESVVRRVINEPFRSLAPTFGVDVSVVAKWALKSLRTRALRDRVLAAMFVFIVVVSVLSFLWPQILIMLPIVLFIAWQAVSLEYLERIHILTQKMLRDRFDPDDAPRAHSDRDRTRLEEVEKRRDGNLVVFSGHSAFIGSGQRLHYQRILLDVSRGREDEEGTPVKPDEFTSQDLHAAIVRAFDGEIGLAKSLANIKVYERLFVNGLHIQGNDQLLPNSLRSPPTSVDRSLLIAATLRPTAEARSYVCVEMPGWQGQLVVTMFIRAVHTGDSLYVDWTFQVLPPLKDQFLQIDRLYETSRYRQVSTSLLTGIRMVVPALFSSPFKVVRTWRLPRIARRRQAHQSHAIRKGYVFDYGAQQSIREDACGTRRRHYFLARDETMYLLLAQQTLTRAVRVFLKDHNVYLEQFDDQVKIIFDNSIKVGNINNSTGVTIGDNNNNSSAKDNGSQKGEK